MDELLNTDISGYSLAEQYLIDEHIEKIREAILSLAYKYVLGDVNADGKMSLIDARFVLKVVSGTEELDRIQFLSADINEDVLTCSASEVLKAGHGICFAKSHLFF